MPDYQNVLIFDSRFENGNLRKAAKCNNIEYNLWLENDTNTRGHTQWFYFKVIYKDVPLRAEKKTHRVRFNVMNLAKTASLYEHGMKPWAWSKRQHEKDGTGWHRTCENVSYSVNQIPRRYQVAEAGRRAKNNNRYFKRATNRFLLDANGAGEGAENYYSLSFTYDFEANKDDEVWFAHAIPYTYTDLNEQLVALRDK